MPGPVIIALIVAALILIAVIVACARSTGESDESMESMMERDLPPEPLRLRDRERSADLD